MPYPAYSWKALALSSLSFMGQLINGQSTLSRFALVGSDHQSHPNLFPENNFFILCYESRTAPTNEAYIICNRYNQTSLLGIVDTFGNTSTRGYLSPRGTYLDNSEILLASLFRTSPSSSFNQLWVKKPGANATRLRSTTGYFGDIRIKTLKGEGKYAVLTAEQSASTDTTNQLTMSLYDNNHNELQLAIISSTGFHFDPDIATRYQDFVLCWNKQSQSGFYPANLYCQLYDFNGNNISTIFTFPGYSASSYLKQTRVSLDPQTGCYAISVTKWDGGNPDLEDIDRCTICGTAIPVSLNCVSALTLTGFSQSQGAAAGSGITFTAQSYPTTLSTTFYSNRGIFFANFSNQTLTNRKELSVLGNPSDDLYNPDSILLSASNPDIISAWVRDDGLGGSKIEGAYINFPLNPLPTPLPQPAPASISAPAPLPQPLPAPAVITSQAAPLPSPVPAPQPQFFPRPAPQPFFSPSSISSATAPVVNLYNITRDLNGGNTITILLSDLNLLNQGFDPNTPVQLTFSFSNSVISINGQIYTAEDSPTIFTYINDDVDIEVYSLKTACSDESDPSLTITANQDQVAQQYSSIYQFDFSNTADSTLCENSDSIPYYYLLMVIPAVAGLILLFTLVAWCHKKHTQQEREKENIEMERKRVDLSHLDPEDLDKIILSDNPYEPPQFNLTK